MREMIRRTFEPGPLPSAPMSVGIGGRLPNCSADKRTTISAVPPDAASFFCCATFCRRWWRKPPRTAHIPSLEGMKVRSPPSFERGGSSAPLGVRARHLAESRNRRSVDLAAWHVRLLTPYVGTLEIRRIHDGTLERLVADRVASGVTATTINRSLEVARTILNRARALTATATVARGSRGCHR